MRIFVLLLCSAAIATGVLLWMESTRAQGLAAQASSDIAAVIGAFDEHRKQHGQWPDSRKACANAINAMVTGRFLDASFMLKRPYAQMATRCDDKGYLLQVAFTDPFIAEDVATRMAPSQITGNTLVYHHVAR